MCLCVGVCVPGLIRSVVQTIFTFYSTLCFAFVLFPISFCLPLLTVFSWSKCEANVALLTEKSHFNTRQWSNCVIAMTASNINFHSWVIKLQINQANRVFVFAISGPGCNVSSTTQQANIRFFPRKHSRCLETVPSHPEWGIEWALVEFSTMYHKLMLWAPEDSGYCIPTSDVHI